jgi:hypothetical protein
MIEPDTKDWTWVLHRPCPECGYDAADLDVPRLPDLLRGDIAVWRDVLSSPGVGTRPRPTTWSPLEYACHVRDVCRLYAERLDLMLTRDDPLFPNWDQDATAVADRYREQDPQRVADELTDAVEVVANAFAAVEGEQWRRRGRRDDGASFTVDSFARYFFHDLVHHRHDVGQA